MFIFHLLQYITNNGSKVIFRTNKNAPNYRLISVDLNDPAEEKWTTLLAEDEKDVLDWASCVDKNKLVTGYLHDVKVLYFGKSILSIGKFNFAIFHSQSALQVHDLDTGKLLRKFQLEIGQIVSFSGDKKYSEVFYQFMSFLTPGAAAEE